MVVVKCSYVAKLLDPMLISSNHYALMDKVIDSAPIQPPVTNPFGFLTGQSRYGNGAWRSALCTKADGASAEFWFGNHPSLRPCDLYPEPTYVYGYGNKGANLPDTGWQPELFAGVRFPASVYAHAEERADIINHPW